ncbi:MAG: hypothetical protein E7424_04105 [Ruminococcaceae bacterium]|nr:hypothetical protein [Oscillospiraceae bacterium]
MKAQIPKYGITIVDGTIYVVENAVSPSAKETAYTKLKRMILTDAEQVERDRDCSQKIIKS